MSSLRPHVPSDIQGSAFTSERRHRATRAQIAAACFFVAFLAAQILIPLVQLVRAPRPARFGWQMYSVVSAAPRFELEMDGGIREPVAIERYVTSLRGDVPLARFLPAHLCGIFPDAVAVHYQMHDSSQSGTYLCDS